jgi:23S rRNA U2552 (ribose-2'-O)-methylase RlmE/FtsJ
MSGLTTGNTKIKWFTTLKKIQQEDIEVIKGEWNEDPNVEIEALKESIQPYDRTELWDLAKRITNPYELVSTFSSRLHLPKSTCCLHPLSRSFFKMVEILKHLNFFERHSKVVRLKSLHICEGPGGFIEAFLNRAEQARMRVHTSYGMTLKSTNSVIPGWRRAHQFLQRNTNVQLIYGSTGTGDIYDPENQESVVKQIGSGVQFITADGGFDFSEDFHAQEKHILRLLINSAILILRCLAEDGDCVLKIFDIQSQATRDFISMIASCFKSWTLYKPITSRPCNSEWYFLGKSVHRDNSIVIKCLTEIRDILTNGETLTTLLKENQLNTLLKELQEQRLSKQEQSLREVLEFCMNRVANKQQNLDELWNNQRTTTIQWCYTFGMPTHSF